jgi:hypothetical protein
MSITNLYRSSRSTSKRAYNSGYAAACADLLQMIQQGVSDSETPPTIGRVMDWVEARLEAVRAGEEDEEDEDEDSAGKKDAANSQSQTAKLRAGASSAPPRPSSAPAVPQQTPREQVRTVPVLLLPSYYVCLSASACCMLKGNPFFFRFCFSLCFLDWFLGTACAVEIIATDHHRTDRATINATISTRDHTHCETTVTSSHEFLDHPNSQTPRVRVAPTSEGEPPQLDDDRAVGSTPVPDIPRITLHVHRVPIFTFFACTDRGSARDPASAHGRCGR